MRQAVLGVVVSLYCGHTARVWPSDAPVLRPDLAHETALATPAKTQPKITVSWKTTRITEPLTPDGYVDYAAAVDAHNRHGVTPDNNAAVLLWKSFGPAPIPMAERDRFYRQLGIDPLPEDDDYFDFDAFWHRPQQAVRPTTLTAELKESLRTATTSPWSTTSKPEVADWLKVNERHLAIVTEASHRPRYYSPRWSEPAIAGRNPVFLNRLIDIQAIRIAADGLAARAMLSLNLGQVDAALLDLETCHRLARLACQDGHLISALVGIRIDTVAFHGEQLVAQHGRLTSAAARELEFRLRTSSPLVATDQVIDQFERWYVLDLITLAARSGLREASSIYFDDNAPLRDWILRLADDRLESQIDWDLVLGLLNEQFDRCVAIFRKANPAERRAALMSLISEVARLNTTIGVSEPPAASGALTNSVWLAQLFIAETMPVVHQFSTDCAYLEVQPSITRLAYALAAFRADHGRFPKRLAELEPKYVDSLPKDLFTGRDFVYRTEGAGYLLYSCGANGLDDDGGTSYESIPPGDDIALRDTGWQYRTTTFDSDIDNDMEDQTGPAPAYAILELLVVGLGTVVAVGAIARARRRN